MGYIDDMGMDFEFENQFRELGSCVEFSEMNEDNFNYIKKECMIKQWGKVAEYFKDEKSNGNFNEEI